MPSTFQNLKGENSMADTIIIRCYKCGHEIGRVSYVPGKQRIGCQKCGAQTDVRVDENGKVYTS